MNDTICGYIPVNKAEGFTSFDVCAVVRRAVGIKRVGHTGTLDPMATGVLPVLIGRATLAADIIPVTDKTYEAGFALGFSTDTFDSSGRVTEKSENRVTQRQLADKLSYFSMPRVIKQLPPMYSAVKIGGKKLYELARRGLETERPYREVTIFEAALIAFDEVTQKGSIRIHCSAGTYIRTFIDDLGRELGTLGTMTALTRTKANGVDLADCVSVLDIKADHELASKHLLPVENLFLSLPKIDLADEDYRRYKNGVQIFVSENDGNYRVKNDGVFIGIGSINTHEMKAVKSFVI